MHFAKRLEGTSSGHCFVSVTRLAITRPPRAFAAVVPIRRVSTYQNLAILPRTASDISWKDAEAELERDRSTSTPEVIGGMTEAEQVEPPPRYEATPSPTPVRRASEKIA
jgi:hypothetical protein